MCPGAQGAAVGAQKGKGPAQRLKKLGGLRLPAYERPEMGWVPNRWALMTRAAAIELQEGVASYLQKANPKIVRYVRGVVKSVPNFVGGM